MRSWGLSILPLAEWEGVGAVWLGSSSTSFWWVVLLRAPTKGRTALVLPWKGAASAATLEAAEWPAEEVEL